MFLSRLVYFSKPTWIYDSYRDKAADLDSILNAGRRNNPAMNVTGALLFDGEHFVQVLEGRRDVVSGKFCKILSDPRHTQIVLAGFNEVEQRLFSDWSVFEPSGQMAGFAPETIPDPDCMTFDMLVGFVRRHRMNQPDIAPALS